ncbi:putative CDC50/LEM3 family protein [Helianthus anomalus]
MVTQQELPDCKPILTPKWVILTFMLVTVVFIPIGVASLLASRDVVKIIDQYDNACLQGTKSQKVQSIQDPTTSKTCVRRLTISFKQLLSNSDFMIRDMCNLNSTSNILVIKRTEH